MLSSRTYVAPPHRPLWWLCRRDDSCTTDAGASGATSSNSADFVILVFGRGLLHRGVEISNRGNMSESLDSVVASCECAISLHHSPDDILKDGPRKGRIP